MALFWLSLIGVLLAMAGLAIGLLLGRDPPRGSCGTAQCQRPLTCAACPRRRSGSLS